MEARLYVVTKLILHPCFQELLALARAQSLQPRCRQLGLPALALAWAEGPGSAAQKRRKIIRAHTAFYQSNTKTGCINVDTTRTPGARPSKIPGKSGGS